MRITPVDRVRFAKVLLTAIVISAVLTGAYTWWKFRMPPEINFSELRVVVSGGEEQALGARLPAAAASIVIFGQSWCHDCHREMRLLHDVRQKSFPGIPVVVLTDEDAETTRAWERKISLPFIFYRLNTSLESLGIYSYPTTYILDKNHRATYSKVGDIRWHERGLSAN